MTPISNRGQVWRKTSRALIPQETPARTVEGHYMFRDIIAVVADDGNLIIQWEHKEPTKVKTPTDFKQAVMKREKIQRNNRRSRERERNSRGRSGL